MNKLNTVGIVSTVKAKPLQLKLFVNYHLNIGVDYMILFFDDPDDECIKLFTKFDKVIAIPCTDEYWQDTNNKRPGTMSNRQIVNVNEGARILESKRCEWLINIDSDELLNPLLPLKAVFAKSNADIIRFSLFEAVSESETYDHIFIPTLFRKKSNQLQITLAKILGCSNAIYDGEYLRGHRLSKIAVRISKKIDQYRIHKVLGSKDLIREETKKIQLLHYDGVGMDSWKLKWDRRLDGTAKEISLRDNRKKQMRLYKNAKQNGNIELKSLFKRMHFIPEQEKKYLYILGMLKKIKLKPELFECKNN